ncbi:hypothetical protein FRC03_008549 [Tulasnella sp. 419]|nr:hypothetical protein FRC03_008549 [Tulasnella sp. 419]
MAMSSVPVTPPGRSQSRRNVSPKGSPQAALPMTPPSPAASNHTFFTRTLSIGYIPIYYDASSPQFADDMGPFPSSGSANNSPQTVRSEHTFGEGGAEGSPQIARNQDSPSLAMRMKWKARHTEKATNASSPEVPSSGGHEVVGARIGLNIIDASPTRDLGSKEDKGSSETSISLSTRKAYSRNAGFLQTKDDLDASLDNDNDDALSCFSISAYLRPDTPSSADINGSNEEAPSVGVNLPHTPGTPTPEPSPSRTPTSNSDAKRLSHNRRRARSSIQLQKPIGSASNTLSPPSSPSPSAKSPSNSSRQEPLAQSVNFSRPLKSQLIPTEEPDTPIVFSIPLDNDETAPSDQSGSTDSTIAAVPSRLLRSVLSKDDRPITSLYSQGSDPSVYSVDKAPSVMSRRGRSSSSAGSSSSGRASTYSKGSVELPTTLEFLRDAVLDLYIDQEGFRAIRVEMVLVKHRSKRNPETAKALHSRASSFSHQSLSGSMLELALGDLDKDMVEFRTKTKEAYNFHYGTLDSQPVLRRVALNGEEETDYISRQASLSLRGKGIYNVEGTEGKFRIPWRFAYMVEDRQTAIGTSVPGEKVLIPLSFCCSPSLFDPERAMKVKLLHVVRKSVTPKISSSRIKPPRVPVSPTKSYIGSEEDGSTSGGSDQATSTTSSISKTINTFAKAVSRPTTPKRPTAPRRPSTARESPRPFNVTGIAADSKPQVSRQRAASLSTTTTPSTTTRADWNSRFHSPRGGVGPVSPASSSTEAGSSLGSRKDGLENMKSPYVTNMATTSTGVPGGKIVTPAQLQAWLSNPSPSPTPPPSAPVPGIQHPLQSRPASSKGKGRTAHPVTTTGESGLPRWDRF